MVVHTQLISNNTVSTSSSKFKRNTMAAAVAALSTIAFNASAQEASGVVEELVVTGTRATIQDSIDLKRNSVTVVDGLNADEIGEIPALSIGEALETITGATSHRENGGATEVSVRGLGPFLGTTVVNGREATNGGGNRAVNFSIFPSEMFNKIAIHKTQSAEYIEGAVSGQVHLDTKKPLEYGKQNIQFSLKGAYAPEGADIDGGQEIGSRFTASYIDQFDIGDSGSLGISIGGQLRDESNPEQEYTTTSGGGRLEACQLESFAPNALPVSASSSRCRDTSGISNDEIEAILDADNGIDSTDDIPWAYIAADHRYRRNTTGDKREALFGVVQWQPNDVLDITFDAQYSERDQTELRQDFQFATTSEGIQGDQAGPDQHFLANPYTGVPYVVTSDTQLSNYTTDFRRYEEYEGAGLNFEVQATDDLLLKLDLSHSSTIRVEDDIEVRLGASDNNEVGGNRDDFTATLELNQNDGVALATIYENDGFTPTDASYFNGRDRMRLRARRQVRENDMHAVRADFELTTDDSLGFVDVLKGGMRVSSLSYLTRGGNRSTPGVNLFEDEDLTTPNGASNSAVTDAVLANALACAEDSFPEPGFLEDERAGDLITVSTTDGSSVQGFNEWATFDFDCLANAITTNYGGASAIQLLEDITSGTIDVTEDTVAFYLQADFESELAGYPVRGNFGVRLVDTEIDSTGYFRDNVQIIETDGDDGSVYNVELVGAGEAGSTVKSGYTEILPSATFIMDLSDELVLRAGIFKGLSRPDPNAYGNGISISDSVEDTDYVSVSDAQNAVFDNASSSGNPYLEPLTSMNYDLGLEWYVNDDTLLSGAVYYKNFIGGFENVAQTYDVNINGELVAGPVPSTATSDDEAGLYGLELTATHAFDYLPGFLSGTGVKWSYNYAQSDFEFEDQHGGDGVSIAVDSEGNVVESELIGILEPAGLFGLSEHVSATQLYWQNDYVNVQTILKTRSNYFQQYTRDTQGRIRYTDDNSTLDLRVSYKVLDNVTLSFEGKNLTDEPRRDFRGVEGNVLQVLSYGPRYFAGVKVKF